LAQKHRNHEKRREIMANIERFQELKELNETFTSATAADLDIAAVIDSNSLQIRVALNDAAENIDARRLILETIKTEVASALGGKEGLLSTAKTALEAELLAEAQAVETEINTEAADVNDVIASLGGE
jgi:hypothetical protein